MNTIVRGIYLKVIKIYVKCVEFTRDIDYIFHTRWKQIKRTKNDFFVKFQLYPNSVTSFEYTPRVIKTSSYGSSLTSPYTKYFVSNLKDV